MSTANDALVFAEEPEPPKREQSESHWKILIVDDEPQVHSVTRLALRDVRFDGGALEFISAYNGAEARAKMQEHSDIALVLLDIVMETSDAGLKVANYIRHELHNHSVRIILRTGQPGEIPEREVINNYEINDYKTKTDLTAQKLYTVVMTALRSYRDLCLVEENSRAMAWLLESSRELFLLDDAEGFRTALQTQLQELLEPLGEEVDYWIAEGHSGALNVWKVVPPRGDSGKLALKEFLPEVDAQLDGARVGKGAVHCQDYRILGCAPASGLQLWIGVRGLCGEQPDAEEPRLCQLLQLWGKGVSAAYCRLQLSLSQQREQQRLEKKISQRAGLSDTDDQVRALSEALAHQKARRARLIQALKACRRQRG